MSFFGFLSTMVFCGAMFGIASVVALSLPQSRFPVVLKEVMQDLETVVVEYCAMKSEMRNRRHRDASDAVAQKQR